MITRHRKLYEVMTLVVVSLMLIMAASITTSQAKKTTIRYHIRTIKTQLDFRTRIKELFEKEHPDISIKIESIDAAEYQTKLLTMFAGGTIGDSFWNSTDTGIPLFTAVGLMRPLDALVTEDNYNLGQFFGSAVNLLRYKGELYWLPDRAHPGGAGIFYNKEIFDEYGVEYPNYAWTYGDLVEKAKKLTVASKKQWGFLAPLDMFWLVTILRSFGGGVLNESGTEALMDRPESIEAMKYVRDLLYEYKVAAPVARIEDTLKMFSTGRIAMYIGGCWNIGQNRYYMEKEWGVGPVPRGAAGRVTFLNVGAQGITSSSKHPEETWEWLKFLSSSIATQESIEFGIVPAPRLDAWFSSEMINDPQWNVFVMALDRNPPPWPVPANYRGEELRFGVFNPTADLIWREDRDVEETCKLLQSKLEELLQKPMP